MTDEEKASILALMISDIPGNPYYPIFTPEQYAQFLMMAKGSVERAVVPAAISASMIIGSDYTREVIGDLQLGRNAGANYLKALEMLIKNKGKSLPDGLMPWSASVPSFNKLLDFARCDCDDPRLRRPEMAPAYEQWVRDLDKGLKDANVEIDANETAITDVSNRVSINTTSLTTLEARVSDSESDIVELKAMDASQNETLTAHSQAISELQTTTVGTNSSVDTLTTRVSATEGDVTSVKSDIVNLKIADQKLEIDDLYGETNEHS